MQGKPPRPPGKRSLLLRPTAEAAWPEPQAGGRLGRQLRAARRSTLVALWTLVAVSIQAGLLLLPGRAKIRFARIFWVVFCRLMGLDISCIGRPARRAEHGGRPVVFVSNHSSWLDVAVLGSRLHACFVSKRDVDSWPGVNVVARLGRTVFVSRQRSTTGRERDRMLARLAAGDNLVLFPEGTTSDGSRVLPFRSSFLAVAEGEEPPIVQPISIVYDRLGGLPANRATRPLFAYYGDMSIGPHFWRLAQWQGLRATMLLHAPLDPRSFPDRKALTKAVWRASAEGAAALRQNRPAAPRPPPASADAPLAYTSLAHV
ncbi:MAG: 1-acyl-sn-glycerol-3-phosphate acyltransferase [Acidisphaera sp.]|nr:1-acyl-sn-glycerol-3-phosphate acyltransferase [Acidisphaera sp.]